MTTDESNSDMIIDLPDNVIDCILSKLPIRDAVRTSMLSKKWRYRWITLPYLVFAYKAFLGGKGEFEENKFVKFINNVLFLHDGPILKFALSISCMRSYPEMDQWIVFLSRKNVVNFTLENWNGERHKLHSRFFSLQKLTNLKLRRCIINPPADFSGFKCLRSLELYRITIADDALESLISSCPLLKKLKLYGFNYVDRLNIQAPQLKKLYFFGKCKSMCFGNTPRLAELEIRLKKLPEIAGLSLHEKSINLYENVGFLSSVKRLCVGYHFLKFLAAGSVPKKLPITLKNLSSIELFDLPFDDLDVVSCTLLLMQSSRKLHDLNIKADSNSSADMESVVRFLIEENCSFYLRKLLYVKLTYFSGVTPEMEFIKFILVKSPLLQMMIVEPNEDDPFYIESRVTKDLIRFPRASKTAEIIYNTAEITSRVG
ncbi:hypothetical protein P3X46_023107 [Hevea brasiliensis]|uniref:F-box domain-containing protein n=1 Tax=Hevea brasiliensis TaxID=3981 RepID=A0ABQ9LCM2_HEVBR|nr:F-box/FBD/LRR-repeat protein At1g13570 [Hevea brasiliensis]KAJ9163439.1 hypothetical protein P3X46_023107 [Hevea brasiliensis]